MSKRNRFMFVLTLRRRTLWTTASFVAVFLLMVLAGRLTGLPLISEHNAAQPVIGGKLLPLIQVDTSLPAVALTFDISWGEVMPAQVLDILKKENVIATFFCSGPWAKKHPEVIQRIIADGHQLESHGQAHTNYSGLTKAGVLSNVDDSSSILKGISGREIRFVRPPNGDYNDQAIVAAAERNVTLVTWSVDSLDWKNPGVETIQSRVLTRIHNGAIVLLHASDTCKQTHLALPTILAGLREKGLNMVTLDQLLAMKGK